MRLYLSSFRLGDKSDELVQLFGQGTRVAVIANATDLTTPEERKGKVQSELKLLQDLGFVAEEIDLRDYFSQKDELCEYLSKFKSIWVRGGNVFLLRRAFRQSGFDDILIDLLKNDKISYGGYSAGICILAPTLRGLNLVDTPHETSDGYVKDIIWEGLNLIPYSIAPHYKSDRPESANVDKSINYFLEHDLPFKPLKDGEVIVVHNS